MARILLLMVVLLAAPVSANMASPWRPGDVVGVPSISLRSIRIEHEALRIDLRPLTVSDKAAVTAIYRIVVGDEKLEPDLVFIAPGQEGRAIVTLDGQPLEATVYESAKVAEAWKAPQTMPNPSGGAARPYDNSRIPGRMLAFRPLLTPGTHEIKVEYTVQADAYSPGDESTVQWHVAYILSPARQWGGFGGLDLEVYVPAGWRTATSIDLVRDGDVLKGRWDKLPADNLGISVQAPPPAQFPLMEMAGIVAFVATVIGACLAGGVLARGRRSVLWGLLVSGLLGGAAATMIVCGAMASRQLLEQAVGSNMSWNYQYGSLLLALMISVPFGLACVVIGQMCVWMVHRKVSKRLS